nr:uncharacterized protein LOC127299101 [Lolium perenne]
MKWMVCFILQEAQGVDRLTLLTDDILLSILGRVDHAVAARTSVLSKRWRNLPWLLPELSLHVRDFLPAPSPDLIEAQHMSRAMASLTKSTSSLLGNRRSDRTITRLSLQLYMTGNRSRDIGLLVSDAINREMVKELHLAIVDEKGLNDCENEDMLRRALRVDGFFGAYPSVLRCLTRLHLVNARFAKPDLHHSLFDCGRQLQHLSIENCDTGDCSVWQIDAPDSKLRIPEIYFPCWQRVEVFCLPKLERLSWEGWWYFHAPLLFGSVPALKELYLLNPATPNQRGFSLAEVLHGTTNVNTLALNFQGEKLWIQPEGKQLRDAFSKLRKLCIHGIYVEFDLFWTMNLLEAAPSIETFDVEVYEHPCEDVTEG